jgi:uncharacterized protein (DUF2147 family)
MPFLLAPMLSALVAAGPVQGLDVTGLWTPPARDAQIEILDCGDRSPCGFIRSVIDPAHGGRDGQNPDPALRGRALAGAKILYGFTRAADGWTGGRIYDPKSGRTYDARLKLKPSGELLVSGCVGPFCQTQTWGPVR